MKNIFKFGFFALFLSMAACSDATDIIQESELDEEAAFQTVADLESGLNGVYAAYGPDFGGNGDGDAILFNDLFTDNIKRGHANNGQGADEYNFLLQPNSTPPTAIWENRYATINRINRVLRAYERIYPTLGTGNGPEQTGAAEQVKGQLLAMRALCHLDLFEYFTVDYTNGADPSIIIMDFVPELTDAFQRNTVAEVTAFIREDLDQAYDLIGNANATTFFFVNENVIKAIDARFSLDIKDYERAEDLSDDLIAAFPLSNTTDYIAMFEDQSRGEIIWALSRLDAPGEPRIAGLWYANNVSSDGSPTLEASKQLYNLFSDDDVRKFVTFHNSIAGPDDTDPDDPTLNGTILITKYNGSAAQQLINDVKVFRGSEFFLIKAECQARRADLAGAAATIQAIRVARYAAGTAPDAPVFATANAALTEVLYERRKELAFEGHRYLDLKRLGRELNIGINRDAADAATFSAPTQLAPSDYRFTMPVPQSELNANNIITQNPGYPVNN